ncbi:MAG: GNAT family N-acetyltransferase [Pseudomonadota bacterium]
MQNISIEIAQLDDVVRIAPLFDAYRQFYEQVSDKELAINFLSSRLKNNESVILMAENNEQQAVGFCQLYPSFCSVIAAPIYVLYDLFVDAKMRQLGIGKQLMQAAHQHALMNNFARLDLTTAKNNFTAQALYESLGWIKDEIFYSYNKTVRQ